MAQAAPSDRPLLQALRNQRLAALCLAGPALGVLLVDAIFGLPRALLLMALGMVGFTAILFGILLQGEYRAVRRAPRR
jgi:hypothetical protein